MRRHPDISRPLEHRGFVHSFLVIVAAFVPASLLIMLIVLALTGRAPAHDWYPPACCSGHDCGIVDSSRITREGVDYIVDHRWRVIRTEAKLSPDGRFHGCWPDKDKPPVCFYAPMDGM